MDRYKAVLVNVWREASRHEEIGLVTRTAARLLAAHLPAGQWIVRRVDVCRGLVETVAVGGSEGEPSPGDARSEIAPDRRADLGRWAMAGAATICRLDNPVGAQWRDLATDHAPEECLIAPLTAGEIHSTLPGAPAPRRAALRCAPPSGVLPITDRTACRAWG